MPFTKGIRSLFTARYVSDDAPAPSSIVARGGGPGDGGHCGGGGDGGDGDGGHHHHGDGGDGDGGDGGHHHHGEGGGHRSHDECDCYEGDEIQACILGIIEICIDLHL